jgi:hypothetical protein
LAWKEEFYGIHYGHPAAAPGRDRGPGRRSRGRSGGRGQRGHAQFGNTELDNVDDGDALIAIVHSVTAASTLACAFEVEDA